MDSDDEEEESDIEFSNIVSPVVKERSRRNVAKPIKYNLDDSDEKMSTDDEPELFDNEAIKENNTPQQAASDLSSESDTAPPKQHETSEDMFDSLIGKQTTKSPITTLKKTNINRPGKKNSSPSPPPEKPKPIPKRKRAPKPVSTESDSEDPKAEAKKLKPKKKKKADSSDDDFDIETVKKAGRKNKKVSSDSEDDTASLQKSRTVRAKAKIVYNIDDDDDDDDDI